MVCDDNTHETDYTYDAADRLTQIKDDLNSTVDYTYDLASNVIRTTETEKSDTGGVTETFYTESYYDELDRLIASASHLGNTRSLFSASRGNVLQVSDAMAAVGTETLSTLPDAPASYKHIAPSSRVHVILDAPWPALPWRPRED